MINELAPEKVFVRDLPEIDSFKNKNKQRNGGFSVHGYSWVYEDCELLVTALCPSLKPLSRFRFDRLLHEKNLNIACVAEFAGHGQNNHDKASQSKYKVLVSLTRDIPNAGLANCSSWLVLLDVRLHQVIRVIDCPFRIVKIEPISLAHQIQAHNLPLNEHIKHSDGLVALGTSTGVINLIDLQLDGWRPDDDRSTPYRLHVLHPDSLAQENWSLESKRRLSEMNHQLICVPLNSDSQYKGQFLYQQSQGEYETIPFDQVEIGALRYFVQTNTLYVGFSFGGFQGWSLQTLQIVFGCQLEQYLTPVIGFSLQEPENDPCNYCYLWVMRGCADQGAIEYQDCIYSSASLFVFEYDQKQWTKDFGYMYSRLVSEGIRFEYYMTSTPYSANVDSTVGGGSTLIAHGTLPKSVPSSTLNQYGDMDEECLLMDSSLFYFVWEAFDNQFENITRYLAIFDLNQWYQSQIPAALQLETAASFSPYICFYKLSRLESKGPIRSLLDAKIDANQVERYPHRAYSNEIAYYPCSLSFSVYFLTETQTIESNFVGLQSSCLSALRQDSRSVLLEPSEFLSRCLFSGLLSSDSIGQLNTLDKRREAVLTLALEHDQLPFLLATIEWWAEETIADTGCSVKFFLNWLWKQVAATKNSIDQLIEVLFDPTPDAIGLRSLRSQRILLGNLRSLLKGLINCGAPNTAQGERELVERLSIVDCIFDYTRVVMWLYGCDLLQSHSMCESIDWIQTYEQLQSNCDRRRTNARTIDSACAGQELLIDSLLKHTPEVSKMWREHGSSGHYPPTNLHSIVSIYLIESLPIELKHEIMLYHLYDLVSLLEQTHPEVVHKILTFPLYFSLRSDLTRLVESLSWFDREEILNATSLLRTSSLRLAFPHELYDYKSLEDDLQVRIVRLFLAHKCTHQAYRFMNSALFNCDSLIKQQLYIKVLMQSKNVLAAFKFQKQHRSQTNGEQLLYQLFLDCEELALFDKVFKLTLDQVEEQALICYLLDVSKSLKSRFLLVIYFMVRERPFEGADVLQSIRNEIDLIQDESTYQKAVELKSLVDAYLNTSPPFLVQMRTINSQLQSKSLESVTTRRLRSEKGPQPVAVLPEATLNTPLSAFVANLFQQIESIEQIAPKPNIATPFSKRIEKKGLLHGQDSPFLRRKSVGPQMLERTPVLRKPHFVAYQKENADDANEADNESFGNINVSFNVSIRPSISRGRSDLVKVLHTPNIKPTNRNLAKVTRTDCATPASILKVRPAKTMPNQVKLDKPLRFDSDGEDEPSTILEPTMDIEPDSDQDRFSDIGMQQPGHLLKATDGQHMEADVTNLQEHDMSVEHSMQHPTHDPNAVDEFVFSESNEIQMSEATKEQMMTGEHKDGMTDQELTPTKISYVFSPPLTRSRRKKSSGKLSKKEDPCLDDTFGKSDTTISADSNTTASTSGNTNPSSEEKKSGRKTPKRNARTTTTTTATADTPSHSMRLRK